MFLLRVQKALFALSHPTCWCALAHGVAPTIEHRRILHGLVLDGVIDVGANRGQFSLLMRLMNPGVRIVAFEPIPDEASIFREVHRPTDIVFLVESALGELPGQAILHMSRSADSSSLLPIGRRQAELFSGTEEIGTLPVAVKRLDDFVSLWAGRSKQLLKLDVQGFELNVLRGGIKTLRSCAYVYAECSHESLYDGQALFPEVESFLNARGFSVLRRCNEQYANGRLIQADYLFERKGTGIGEVESGEYSVVGP